MVGRIVFREDTQDILKDYAFNVYRKRKIFCPNCLKVMNEVSMKNHFALCSYILKGEIVIEGIFKGEKVSIIKNQNDAYLRNYINRLKKFIDLEDNLLSRFNYNKNHEYFLLQINSKNWGILTIGLASVNWSKKIYRYVLPAIIVYPEKNRNLKLGSFFLDKINEYYNKIGNIVVEAPNDKIIHICKKLEIDYYHE